MTDHEAGYRARVADLPEIRKTVNDHFDGVRLCNLSDEWFAGWEDATDDLGWKRQGIDEMQYGL